MRRLAGEIHQVLQRVAMKTPARMHRQRRGFLTTIKASSS
jgi:hypothetical protein